MTPLSNEEKLMIVRALSETIVNDLKQGAEISSITPKAELIKVLSYELEVTS